MGFYKWETMNKILNFNDVCGAKNYIIILCLVSSKCTHIIKHQLVFLGYLNKSLGFFHSHLEFEVNS